MDRPKGLSFFMNYYCPTCGEHYKKKLDKTEEKFGPVCPNCGVRDCFISTPVVPSWRKYEKPMKTGDGHSQFEASEKFTYERDKEIKSSPKMARWEESRKKYLFKQKGQWLKKEKEKLKKVGL